MNKIVLIIISVFVSYGSLAEENILRRLVKDGCYGALHRQFLDFDAVFTYQLDTDDAEATVGLLNRFEKDEHKYVALDLRAEFEDAYQLAWQLALQIWIDSKDENAQKIILEKWNTCLAEGENINIPVYALASAWDRAFLNDAFWKGMGKSDQIGAVEAFRYLMFHRGNKQDYAYFIKIRSQMDNLRYIDMVKDLDKWIDFRKEWGDLKRTTPYKFPETGYSPIGICRRYKGDMARLKEVGGISPYVIKGKKQETSY